MKNKTKRRRITTGFTIYERLDFYTYPEPMSGCWLWTGSTTGAGKYGGLQADGRLQRSHRLQWERFNGPIPKGLLVCHHCDTPLCVNPDHLFLGTYADNRKDSIKKGRFHTYSNAKGKARYWSKFTADKIRTIRNDGRIGKVIALEYGMSKSAINRIKARTTWPHII